MHMPDNNNLFNFIKERVSILTVINEQVSLKKAGFYWKGRCPFHDEKTGSFTVSPHREIFYCFGCHAGGDVITFVSKIENCTQLEAAKNLADRFNIELPQEITFTTSESVDEKKQYFLICKTIANLLHQRLLKNSTALDYLSQRNINSASINQFMIGYLPGGQAPLKAFLQDLRTHTILAKDLLDVHFLEESKGVFHSSFEKRIIFPIKDHLGRFCGFGGRVFEPGDERSKYYNSRETNYFQKGSLLFGLDLAKKEIHKTKTVFLVEGYTDCIAMVQYGYANTVATLGTACTLEHLKQLSYHAEKLYVLYDGDSAGHNAMLRLAELCWQANIDLYALFLPNKKDPADFLASGGKIEDLITKAQDIITFFFNATGSQFGEQSLQQKLDGMRKCLSIIRNISDPFKQEILLQQASTVFNLPVNSLKQELTRLKIKPQSAYLGTNKPENNEGHDQSLAKPEKTLIVCPLEKKFMYVILNNLEILNKKEVVHLAHYLPVELKLLLKKLKSIEAPDEKTKFIRFFDELNDEEKALINELLVMQEEYQIEEFEMLLTQLEKKYWKMITQETKMQLEQAQKMGNANQVNEIVSTFLELKKKLLSRGLI